MSQPAVHQGAAAADVLLDLVVGVRTTEDVVFPVELVVRATTAARRAET
jgi:DNA-binding LacI/PurR family transcriptional regulator